MIGGSYKGVCFLNLVKGEDLSEGRCLCGGAENNGGMALS